MLPQETLKSLPHVQIVIKDVDDFLVGHAVSFPEISIGLSEVSVWAYCIAFAYEAAYAAECSGLVASNRSLLIPLLSGLARRCLRSRSLSKDVASISRRSWPLEQIQLLPPLVKKAMR